MATLVSFWSLFGDRMADLSLIDSKLGLYIKINVNRGGGGGGGNAILGHVHLENSKMALENMALNSLKWPLNQKY